MGADYGQRFRHQRLIRYRRHGRRHGVDVCFDICAAGQQCHDLARHYSIDRQRFPRLAAATAHSLGASTTVFAGFSHGHRHRDFLVLIPDPPGTDFIGLFAWGGQWSKSLRGLNITKPLTTVSADSGHLRPTHRRRCRAAA